LEHDKYNKKYITTFVKDNCRINAGRQVNGTESLSNTFSSLNSTHTIQKQQCTSGFVVPWGGGDVISTLEDVRQVDEVGAIPARYGKLNWIFSLLKSGLAHDQPGCLISTSQCPGHHGAKYSTGMWLGLSLTRLKAKLCAKLMLS
jgi:hypothetical protein